MPEVNYFWDEIEDNVVREYDENNNTIASYTTEPTLYGSVLSQGRSGEKQYFHFDGMGNMSELTDRPGNVFDLRRYSAFGNVSTSTGTTDTTYQFGARYGYHSGSTDSPMAIRRRHYDRSRARWLSTDPLARSVSSNRFAFLSNSPLQHFDPSGLDPFTATVFGGCVVTALAVTLAPATACLILLGEVQNRGLLIHDANNHSAHCFINCCTAKLSLGLPVFAFAFSCKEVVDLGNGIEDCFGDIAFNVIGYFEGVDSLFVTDPYNVSGNCVSRCQRYFKPRPPLPPKPTPEPYQPITPTELREYERQACETWCRDETASEFAGPSPEAFEFYNNCIKKHCRGLTPRE